MSNNRISVLHVLPFNRLDRSQIATTNVIQLQTALKQNVRLPVLAVRTRKCKYCFTGGQMNFVLQKTSRSETIARLKSIGENVRMI